MVAILAWPSCRKASRVCHRSVRAWRLKGRATAREGEAASPALRPPFSSREWGIVLSRLTLLTSDDRYPARGGVPYRRRGSCSRRLISAPIPFFAMTQ